ncbi:MAG: ABC transporter permease [Bacillota bacterium]|nr:ABC transporter permease [Bacillota bacterium]MDW7684168.1 ABC transporter permease [Bacillota bacterium]
MLSFWQGVFDIIITRRELLLSAFWEHVWLSGVALVLICAAGIPAGILITRMRRLAPVIIGFAGFLYTIPSIALFGFMIPLVGIGVNNALIALFIYGLMPLIRNTYVGIREVDASVVEAARGMGATDWQILRDVEIPLALPLIVAGFRTVTVMTIAVATIAAFIGAGGLGAVIWRGINTYNPELVMAGSIPVAMMAVSADGVLGMLEKVLLRRSRGDVPSSRLHPKAEQSW